MRLRLIAIAAAALAAAVNAAAAQTMPYVYAKTVGTSVSQVLGINAARKRVEFFNPNPTALIAVCPAGPNRDNGSAVTCTVGGPGSITLLPYWYFRSDALQPQSGLPSAWNAIANGASSSLTILEYE